MASDLNRWIGVGRLVADPELRTLASGQAVCSARIAVNASQKDQSGEWSDRGHFFSVTIWGKQAESIARNCTKGQRIGIDGRLQQRQWETPEGQKREQVSIVAQSVQFLDPRSRDLQPESQQEATAPSDDLPF